MGGEAGPGGTHHRPGPTVAPTTDPGPTVAPGCYWKDSAHTQSETSRPATSLPFYKKMKVIVPVVSSPGSCSAAGPVTPLLALLSFQWLDLFQCQNSAPHTGEGRPPAPGGAAPGRWLAGRDGPQAGRAVWGAEDQHPHPRLTSLTPDPGKFPPLSCAVCVMMGE